MSNVPKERKRVAEILELERKIQKSWEDAKAFQEESPLNNDEKYLFFFFWNIFNNLKV